MTAYHYLHLILVGLVIIGWGSQVFAEENVTIYGQTPSSSAATSSSSSGTASNTASADTTTPPATHHKKKKKPVPEKDTETADATAASSTTTHSATAKKKVASTHHVAPGVTPFTAPPPGTTPPPATFSAAMTKSATATQAGAITVTKSTPTSQTQITISAPSTQPPPVLASDKPEVETGLPVARPGSKTYAPGISSTGASRANYPASIFPLPVTSSLGSYSANKSALDNFSFTDFEHRVRRTYPWKLNIVTTMFWIGEDTPNRVSSTNNIASAWDQDWRYNNSGTDTPDERDGNYLPAHHAATINPFYVALPFNDLAFPEKARRWLPAGWYRPPRDGKQVSACQHRWVEIKNAQGDVCYAQWEDVGPLRYDHAEYVFGNERPDTYTNVGLDRAGLDVSPAVAKYLNITDRNRVTSWRFVDDADVQPGKWLQYDEEAVLFKAIRASKDILPIERARAPIDDPDEIDSSQKKLNKAKG